MRLLWLPNVLRAAGLTVHEIPGWQTRGDDSYGPVRGITCHHTAGSRTSSVAGELNVLLNGSNSAPAPISQLFLARSGEWHVVASGLCFHNLDGWGGPNAGYGNRNLLGIEAQHSGGSEPWTSVQYESYLRGVAALVRHKAPGWDVTPARVAGHKEHQPGDKSDPTFDMARFRTQVSELVTGQQEDDMPTTDEFWNRPVPLTPTKKWEADNALGYTAQTVYDIKVELAAARLRDEAILRKVTEDDVELNQIRAYIDAKANEIRPPSPQQNAQAVVEALAGLGTDDLVQVLLRGLGPDRARAVGNALAGPA